MPIPTIVGVSASAASGAGAVTPAFPSGYTATTNDVAVTFIECHTTDTITPPSGWAQIQASNVSTGTAPTKLTAIWRRIQSGDTAPQIADAGDHMVARMIIIRGCVTSGNPWDFATASSETTADTSVSIAAGTTLGVNRLIMAAFSTGQDTASTAGATSWTNVSLGSVTEQMDNWTSSGTGGGFSMATGTKAATGSTGTTTATLSLTANFKAQLLIAFIGAPISASVGQVVETNTARPVTALKPNQAYVAEVVWYNEDSTQPLTVSKPGSFASGQILVAIIHQHSTSDTTLTTPSGWTQIGSSLNGTNSQGKVFAHAFNAGDPSTWDFGYGTTADVCLALIRIVNADLSLVISNTSANTTSITSPFDSPTITPAGSTDLLLCTIGNTCNDNLFSVTVPSGMVDWGKTQAATTFMAMALASQQLSSSSATGAKSWTSVSPTGIDGGSFSVVVKTVSAGGISEVVNQVTETDSAQTITKLKTKAVGQVTETETSQTITRRKTEQVSQISETQTAQVLNRLKLRSATLITESDTAFTIIARKTRVVGQITESDAAQPLAHGQIRVVSQVTETDSTFSLNELKTKLVPIVTQTNTAITITRLQVRTVGLTTNTNIAQAITVRKSSTVALVTESETAQTVTHSKLKLVGLVSETETSNNITNPGAPLIVTRVTEVDTSQSITSRKLRVVGLVTETSVAFAITKTKFKLVGLATSICTAYNIVRFNMPVVTRVDESDVARQVTGGAATSDTHGWMPLLNLHCVYLTQKVFAGNPNYVKRIPVKIIGFASDGYPILKNRQSGVTYGTGSIGIRPRSHPDANEVDVYVSY